MVVCLERGADLHTAQLMPLPLAVSGSSKIHIGFTFLVPAHLGSPGQRAVKRVCVCVCVCVCVPRRPLAKKASTSMLVLTSTGLLQKPVGVSGAGEGSNVRNTTKCVLRFQSL